MWITRRFLGYWIESRIMLACFDTACKGTSCEFLVRFAMCAELYGS